MPVINAFEVVTLTRPHAVLSTHYDLNPKQERSHIIVKLMDNHGRCGYGETTPLLEFTGENTDIVKLVLETIILPCLLGFNTADIAAAHIKMNSLIPGNFAAKNAVDNAMYDLLAKELQVPVYTLLGGKCRDSVIFNRHIGMMNTENAVDLARKYHTQGIKTIKMKVGGTVVESDIERVRSVREIVGPETSIRVDANQGFSYPDACKFIKGVYDCDIEYYEQLLPQWDLKGAHDLRMVYGVHLLADESCHSVFDVMQLAEYGAADAVTVKLCKCGGLYPALRVAGAAEAYGMNVIVASTFDTHIGCSACLHLASALPNCTHSCDLTTFPAQPDNAEYRHHLTDTDICVSDAPGLGVSDMFDFHMF